MVRFTINWGGLLARSRLESVAAAIPRTIIYAATLLPLPWSSMQLLVVYICHSIRLTTAYVRPQARSELLRYTALKAAQLAGGIGTN